MTLAVAGDEAKPERVDDPWVAEYVESGLREAARFLASWAAFQEWCRTHDRDDAE